MMGLLLLLLRPLAVLSAALAAVPAAQECSNVRRSSEHQPLVVSVSGLQPRSTVWFRPTDPRTEDLWTASFHFGRSEGGGSFAREYELQLKKPKGKNFLGCKFFQVGSRKSFLDERFSRSWIAATEGGEGGEGMWTGLRLNEFQLGLTFRTPERQLTLQLTTEEEGEFAAFEDVKVVGDMEVSLDCSGPEGDTTTTTLPSTTSTSTTTPPTTTTTTTTEVGSTTTEPSTEGAPEYPTSPRDATSTSDLESSGCEEEATPPPAVPLWAWACVGLSGALLASLLALLSYTVALHRRNWRLADTVARQGQYLRGRPAGGYGVKASDVQYYEMRNHNVMVGGGATLRATTATTTTTTTTTTSPRPEGRCDTSSRPFPTLQFPSPPSRDASPSPSFLDGNCLLPPPPPPSDDLDALQEKRSHDCSENGLADDERSLGTLDNRFRVRR